MTRNMGDTNLHQRKKRVCDSGVLEQCESILPATHARIVIFFIFFLIKKVVIHGYVGE